MDEITNRSYNYNSLYIALRHICSEAYGCTESLRTHKVKEDGQKKIFVVLKLVSNSSGKFIIYHTPFPEFRSGSVLDGDGGLELCKRQCIEQAFSWFKVTYFVLNSHSAMLITSTKDNLPAQVMISKQKKA